MYAGRSGGYIIVHDLGSIYVDLNMSEKTGPPLCARHTKEVSARFGLVSAARKILYDRIRYVYDASHTEKALEEFKALHPKYFTDSAFPAKRFQDLGALRFRPILPPKILTLDNIQVSKLSILFRMPGAHEVMTETGVITIPSIMQ